MNSHYYVTGIWKAGDHITDMFLHPGDKNIIRQGTKVPVQKVAQLIRQGATVTALKWDYSIGSWVNLYPLELIKSSEGESVFCNYLHGNTALDKMINMACIVAPDYSMMPLVRRRVK